VLSRALVLVGVVHISRSLQCKIEQDMRHTHTHTHTHNDGPRTLKRRQLTIRCVATCAYVCAMSSGTKPLSLLDRLQQRRSTIYLSVGRISCASHAAAEEYVCIDRLGLCCARFALIRSSCFALFEYCIARRQQDGDDDISRYHPTPYLDHHTPTHVVDRLCLILRFCERGDGSYSSSCLINLEKDTVRRQCSLTFNH